MALTIDALLFVVDPGMMDAWSASVMRPIGFPVFGVGLREREGK